MKKLFIETINHYYYLIVLLGITDMLGLRDWMPLLILATIFMALISFETIKLKTIDFLVMVWVSYSVLSSLWTEDSSIAYYGIKSEVVPILFYFIARGRYSQGDYFLENMRVPLLFAFVCALYLFVFPPSWYVDYKTQKIAADASTNAYYEATRLSGFWAWSYFIGYSSLFYIMYQTKKNVIDQKKDNYYIVGVVIAAICMFLAQQRVSIAFFFFFVTATLLYSWKKGNSSKQMMYILGGLILAAFVIYILLLRYLDSGFLEYILERTVNKEGNMVEERFDLFDRFQKGFSFLGGGIGSVGHFALSLKSKDAVTDCDYLRIPNEYGILGLLIVFSIIAMTILRGIKNLKTNWFYMSVIFFLLVAMLGAAPLELFTLEPYLYWYCMGCIYRPQKKYRTN